ncbi:MAG: transposase [Paracoccaceae bacterium]|nr:transposase [Paracoccaceae bacterium]MDG1369249.1 transposase [Paracoccaceae bacterium]
MAQRPRKNRLWTAEEKCSICLQTTAPGVSVAQVARRYSMNANLIFKWLRDTRYVPEVATEDAVTFLPVEVVAPTSVEVEERLQQPEADVGSGLGRIDVKLPCGTRIAIDGNSDTKSIAGLLKALSK